jgi:hypothetical protein
MRQFIIALIVLLNIQVVSADFIVSGLSTLGGEPTSIDAFDSNNDGTLDSAIIGTTSKAVASGMSAWVVSVSGVGGVAAFDHDKNGYMNGVVIAGNDIVAVDSFGTELWRLDDGCLGKSAVGADLDEDGFKDEVVVGCWDKIIAFDSDGTQLWNISDITENNVKNLVLTEKYVIGSSQTYLHFISISDNYPTYRAVAQLENVLKIAPIDLEDSGTLNGVVVIKKKGDDNYAKVNAYSMYAEDQGWSISKYHGTASDVSASPVDRYSNGKQDNVVFNLESGAYWVNNKGVITQIGSVYAPSAIAPIDFDGDNIKDDVIVSTGSSDSAGKLYGFSTLGQQLEYYNQSGGVRIVAVDLDFNGKANDAIVASAFDKRAYSVVSTATDTTTSTAPVTTTPPPTTTAAPVTTAPPAATTAAPAATTAAPAATEAPAANDSTTGTDNASAADTDFDGWPDALEAQMGTDPKNPDTDGDGILDGKDPNPLVAGSSGSIIDRVPGVLFTAIKWIVIIGGGIIALIFIREKILDFLWEKNQDWSE